MESAKSEKVILRRFFFGKDRGVAEKVVVDAIDLGERQDVLPVEYSDNEKGYPQMTVKPTEKYWKALVAAKAERHARYAAS